MTNTALRNKELDQKKEFHDQDIDLEKKKFKHQKVMDVVNAITGGVKTFVGSKGIPGFLKGGQGSTGIRHSSMISNFRRNDPSWYKNYVKDLDHYTNLTSFSKLGLDTFDGGYRSVKQISSANVVTTVGGSERGVPGIAVIEWIPSLGNTSKNANDLYQTPINQILMRTKEQVLKSNSRSQVNYEASDLGYNFLATASIITAIAEFERAILVAQTYRDDNSYYARECLKALGWNNPDIIMGANLAQAKQSLVLLKTNFNSSIVAPADLSIYKKCLYLASMWCKDTECSPNQIYTAVCKKYFRLSVDATKLEVTTPVQTTVNDYVAWVSTLIQRISETPDFVNMYSDLRSAFAGRIFQLDPSFDNDAKILETYDSYTIEQIANVETLPVYYSNADNDMYGAASSDMEVKQDTNGYIYQGASASDQGIKLKYILENGDNLNSTALAKGINVFNRTEHKLNLHKDQISGDDILDASRWHYLLSDAVADTANNEVTVKVLSSDVAIATGIRIYCISSGSLSEYLVGTHMYYHSNELINFIEEDFIPVATVFDWMPLISLHGVTGLTGGAYQVKTVTLGEAQHMMHYPLSSIKTLNMVCVSSQMYVDTASFKI